MSEDWQALVASSEHVFHDKTGMTYEYKQVDFYRHSSGRYFQRYEHLHVDADQARVSFEWVDDAEARLQVLRAQVAQREAAGRKAFYEVGGEGAAAGGASGAGASSAPGADPMAAALERLLTRSGGFVIASEAGGRFVQFAGGVGEPLLLDVPNLSAEEAARAQAAFAGQPFTLNGGTFNLAFGQDAAAAAVAAGRFFCEVLLVASPAVTLEEE